MNIDEYTIGISGYSLQGGNGKSGENGYSVYYTPYRGGLDIDFRIINERVRCKNS